MREHERVSRFERDKEYSKQLEYKNQIEAEIEKSKLALTQLRKSSKNAGFSENKSDTVLDIGEMLDKLYTQIVRIYCEALEIPKE